MVASAPLMASVTPAREPAALEASSVASDVPQGPARSVLASLRARLSAVPRWRFLVLLLLPLALIVGGELHGAMAHDVEVEIRWPSPGVERVSVSYERDGEVLQTAVFSPGRARSVRHEAHLPAGRYAVTVETVGVRTTTYRRRIDSPADGRVVLRVGGER